MTICAYACAAQQFPSALMRDFCRGGMRGPHSCSDRRALQPIALHFEQYGSRRTVDLTVATAGPHPCRERRSAMPQKLPCPPLFLWGADVTLWPMRVASPPSGLLGGTRRVINKAERVSRRTCSAIVNQDLVNECTSTAALFLRG